MLRIERVQDRVENAWNAALVNGDVALNAVGVFETQFPCEGKGPDLHQRERDVGLPKHSMDGLGDLCASHNFLRRSIAAQRFRAVASPRISTITMAM